MKNNQKDFKVKISTKNSDRAKKYFSQCHRVLLHKWLQFNLTKIVITQLLQIYEIQLLTNFSQKNKTENKKTTLMGSLNLQGVYLKDYESTSLHGRIVGILVGWQLVKMIVFWVQFYYGYRKLPSHAVGLRIFVYLNLLDKEILGLPNFYFVGVGLRQSEAFYVKGLSLLLVTAFIVNQLTCRVFDQEYTFRKRKVNSAFNYLHQYVLTAIICVCSALRGMSHSGSFWCSLLVRLALLMVGIALLRDLSSRLHYWQRPWYQAAYLMKVCAMICFGGFNLIKDAFGGSSYANVDLWLITIMFLVFRFSWNSVELKKQSLMDSGVMGAESDEVNLNYLLVAVEELLGLYQASRKDGEPNFKLITYMKRHMEQCSNIYCPCRRAYQTHDFTKKQRYILNSGRNIKLYEQHKLKVIDPLKRLCYQKPGSSTSLKDSLAEKSRKSLSTTSRRENENEENSLSAVSLRDKHSILRYNENSKLLKKSAKALKSKRTRPKSFLESQKSHFCKNKNIIRKAPRLMGKIIQGLSLFQMASSTTKRRGDT